MNKTILLIFVMLLVYVGIAYAGDYIHLGNVRNCYNATPTTYDDVGSRNQDLTMTGTCAYHASTIFADSSSFYFPGNCRFDNATFANWTYENSSCVLMTVMSNVSNKAVRTYWAGDLANPDRSTYVALDSGGLYDFNVNDWNALNNQFGYNVLNKDYYITGFNETSMHSWRNKTRVANATLSVPFSDNSLGILRFGTNQVASVLLTGFISRPIFMNVSCDQDIVNEYIDDKEECDVILTMPDVVPPHITLANCTSCNPPEGDNSSPYTTKDTTPTFVITTNKNALCAIAGVDKNYTTMINEDTARNCTNTDSTQHTCSLQPSELIINETGYVYIGCQATINGKENTTSTSGALEMQITTGQVEIIGENAIMAGINTSTIWIATVYTDQQVYIRDLDNNQVLTTFDKLAVSGNQRWAFNYLDYAESFITGLFNITPAFYAAEYREITYQDVNDSVRTLIDNTKS